MAAYLAKQGINHVETEELHKAEVQPQRTPAEILDIIDQGDETLTADDADVLLGYGYGYNVSNNLDKFTSLDADIAYRLIEAGHGYDVINKPDKFTGLDQIDVAHRLLDNGYGYDVINNLDKFTSLGHTDIARRLIDAGYDYLVVELLDKLTSLDADIAYRLIDAGYVYDVINNLGKFTSLNHTDIARRLIDAGSVYEVICSLDNFTSLDSSIANRLITTGHILDVIHHADAFTSFDWSDIAVETDDMADAVVENVDKLGLAGAPLAKLLHKCAAYYSTAQKISQLDLEQLVGESESSALREYISTIKPERHGVKNVNPYAETAGDMEHVTSTIPGTELHRRTSMVSRELRQEMQADESEQTERAKTILASYDKLLARLTEKFGDEYARQLVGERGKFGDMMPTYRRLVADFIALNGGEHGLDRALADANEFFLQVLSVDTQYYDKLFMEWDAKRIGQRDFQEVFLGRDGVYAYVGRRAQIWARQRKVGLRQPNEPSEYLDLPTYLVYPRGFRDGMDDDVKSAYLQQNIPNPPAAHYYDTGYTGTIPEDIMRVLGVPDDQMDSRVRLLSASERGRTVLGLKGDKNERDQIVNTVEHNVKDENTAQGVYKDGGTERLVPYAAPTDPAERLAFRFTQLALHRHYYAKEMREFPPRVDKFTRHQSGAREMRVNAALGIDAERQLEELFGGNRNIGEMLKNEATALKIADPQDPYPDEAVFELSLPEKGDVIVKNVVANKGGGPLDEFEALLLLQRLGIDAPKPLARIFTEGQAGMIVMEKLAGVSGRTIKGFFEANEISAKKQQEILVDAQNRMQTIAEMVRRDAGLDKPWRLKDFMIEFDESHNITAMRPIDFERARVFDPNSPQSIKLGQGLAV